MALRPLNRPAGSTQVIRYRGTIAVGSRGGGDSDVYPKENAVAPADSEIGIAAAVWVRFALFDPGAGSPPAVAADVANTARRLPENVFDDEAPAGVAPHAPVACLASGDLGINTTDLSMNLQSWAQNLEIRYTKIDTKVIGCDCAVSIDNDPENGAQVLLDNGTTSGLGLGTGLPVIAVLFIVQPNEGALQAFDVDITFEVRHSNHR